MRAAQQRVHADQPPVRVLGMSPEIPFIGGSPAWPTWNHWVERETRWATRQSRGRWYDKDADGCERCDQAPNAEALKSGLWRISSYGSMVVRQWGDGTPVAGVTLPDSVINGLQPLPAGLVASRVGHPAPLVIGVKIADTQARQVLIDAGESIFVYADDVAVSWWGPGPTMPVLGNGTGWVDVYGSTQGGAAFPFEQPEGALIYEGLLYVDIARVEAPRQQGTQYAKLTQTWQAALDTRVIVPIPPGARRVQIARDPTGAVVAGTWQVGFSDGTTFAAVSSLSSGSAVQNRVGFETFQANATHLQSPVITEDHTWTLVWEIAP